MLNFFQLIKPILATNVVLDIHLGKARFNRIRTQQEVTADFRTIFGHLLPLMDGIRTVRTDHHMMPHLKALLREKFAQIKVLDIFAHIYKDECDGTIMQSLMEWLTSNTNNNEPKLLKFTFTLPPIPRQMIVEAIHKVSLINSALMPKF